MKSPTYPFTILTLAQFRPVPESMSHAKIATFTDRDIDRFIDEFSVMLSVQVSKELCPDGVLMVPITQMKDFRPKEIIRNNTYLNSLKEASKFISESLARMSDPQIAEQLQAQWPELPLDLSVLSDDSLYQQPQEKQVDDIFSMVAMPGGDQGSEGPKATGSARSWMTQLEELQQTLLAQIFTSEDFRRTEAIWQGLRTLVQQGIEKDGYPVNLKLAPISTVTLPSILDDLVSQLADEPPSFIIIDVPFTNTPVSIELLQKIAEFADTMMVPTVVWLTPQFFHIDDWSDMKKIPYLKTHFEGMHYAKWRKMKDHPGSNWLVMTCNQFVVRQAYGDENRPRPVFFRENQTPWISPVWAMGTLVAKSVSQFGWPTRLTDYQNIFLQDLAVGNFGGEESRATETLFDEERVAQLVEVGITPIMGAQRKDKAFLFREATVAAGSLKFQFFFNRVIGYLFKLREEIGAASEGSDLALVVTTSMASYFQSTGHEAPPDLSVQIGQTEQGEMIPLLISFTPPRTILPTSEKLEFTFSW